MYQEHFGLNHPPFRITPQTESFYTGAERGPVLDALVFAISHDDGIIRVSGEVGTGKTMLCRMLMEHLPANTLSIYIANPSLSPTELIKTISQELGILPDTEHSPLRQIERKLIELYAHGTRVVSIIDEAHAMPPESLDQIRLLSNLETGTRKLLQIVLFGQPELNDILKQKPMRSLRERITQNFHLQPLKTVQIKEYIDFRLRAAGYKGPELFSQKIIAIISWASEGLTRRVNILADKTLLAAFADNTHTITPAHARSALRDAAFSNAQEWKLRAVAICSAGICLALLLMHAQLSPPLRTPSPPKPDKPTSGQIQPEDYSINKHAISTQGPAKHKNQSPEAQNQATPTANTDLAPIPETIGPIARERLIASRAEIEHINDQNWFIQIRSIPASNAGSLEAFIPAANKSLDVNLLRLYVVKDDPKQTIGVIYGNYPRSKEAYAAIKTMPAWIRNAEPFIRTYKSLRISRDNK